MDRRNRRFCSPKCKNKFFVDKRRKDLKILAVQELGGKCMDCGYNKCIRALCFHHIYGKDFQISSGNTKAWDTIKKELKKCVLVCANCHAERHSLEI